MFDSDLEAAAVAFFSEVFERHATEAADAYAVGLYITAAYSFTASTPFAKPVVTVA